MSSHPAALTLEGHDILFPSLPYHIGARAGLALDDQQLQQFVNTATLRRDRDRRRVCRDVFGENYDAMRKLAGGIKQHTLDYLDHYLEQWIDQATEAGVQVHFAADGKEANDIAVGIARRIGAKLCVKSKSMVTEETHLLPAMEAIGVEMVETDLGEFIIQLDHDAPSHIVTPMIHKNRVSVARAFQRELGSRYTEEPGELTQIARDYLRDKYRRADIGMSGGNFLIAETGSLVICTNEGNGRLCTSVPPVHIAMVGIEKLIPRLEHLGVFLKLLSRSSVGTPITVYNHVMTGPRKSSEADGPREMHVILVDNGRTEILRAETREMLRCIRCGACLNACPVYRKIGGHAYGAVYGGPIGALITPMFRGLANYKDLPYASSLCGACYEACPVHINIPKYLIQLRSQLMAAGHDKLIDRLSFKMWSASLQQGWTYRLGGWMARKALRLKASLEGTLSKGDPYRARGWISRAPGMARGWTDQRDLPTPTAKGFRAWWAQREREQGR